MWKQFVCVYMAIAMILLSTAEAKGGRGGGGRSSGRSSSSRSSSHGSSSGGGFFSFGGSKKSSSSGSSYGHGTSHGSGYNGGYNPNGGGWFHGYFHSAPYHYTFEPSYISVHRHHTHTYNEPKGQYESSYTPTEQYEKNSEDVKKGINNYEVPYSLTRALSGDFFSIFNVVNGISSYPDRIRNKEFTTTASPVATYNLNDVIIPSYTSTEIPTTTTEVPVFSNKFNDFKIPDYIPSSDPETTPSVYSHIWFKGYQFPEYTGSASEPDPETTTPMFLEYPTPDLTNILKDIADRMPSLSESDITSNNQNVDNDYDKLFANIRDIEKDVGNMFNLEI